MARHPNDLDFGLPMAGDRFAKSLIAAAEEHPSLDPTAIIVRAMLNMNDKIDQLADQALVVTSPWVEMPPDGIPYNELGWAAIGAIGTTTIVIQFQVPTGNNGVIRWLGNEYLGPEFVEGNGEVVWQIWADGQPITNFENILGSLGSPSSPSETAPIRIYESQIISLVLENVNIAAAGQLLGGRLSGWYYPTTYDEKRPVVEEAEDE